MTLTSQNIDRHQKIQITRCTKHPKNPKKTKIQQLLRSGPIVPGNFSFVIFFWCLCRFGASSGLFFFVFFFLCLCRFGASIGLFVFFNACAGFGNSRLCMFGSWPYFKLMFQRRKHTVSFE